MILWSTFSICSANASALREELLNFSLNSSNFFNASGVRMFEFLPLNKDAKAPFSPNQPSSLRTLLNLSILSLISSIVFPNIPSSLFFVVNIVLLKCMLWIHTVRLWRTQIIYHVEWYFYFGCAII